MTEYPNLIRCMDNPWDVKVGYKVRRNNEFYTITSIETDGEKYKFTIHSDSSDSHGHTYAWSDEFVEVYVDFNL